MRMSGVGYLNTLSIEYFLVKDDDGGMPMIGATRQHCYRKIARHELPYAINLPSNKLRGHCSGHAIGKIVYV
jgi:hypothetical protein